MYNGGIVVMMGNRLVSYPAVMTSETVAGVEFVYSSLGRYIQFWKDGSFYRLQEAHNQSFLTERDLQSIAYYQNED